MNGKPLSLRPASALVITICCFALFEVAIGIYELHAGQKRLALPVGISAFIVLLTLPIYIANWLKIKKGGTIHLRFPTQSQFPRVPFLVSAAFAILVTISIAVVSYQSFFASLIAHPTRPLHWEMVSFNVFLWLLIGLIWYCLIVTREQKHSEQLQEQPEGVWPPAPLVSSQNEESGEGNA